MGRTTLLLILAIAAPARAETHLSVSLDGEARTRAEVPLPRSAVALPRIDLSRFAVPRWFAAIAAPEPAAIAVPDLAPIAPPEPASLELFELRDNASRDWAPERDFEVAAVWDAFSIAINHHVLDRNWDDLQVTATLTREF